MTEPAPLTTDPALPTFTPAAPTAPPRRGRFGRVLLVGLFAVAAGGAAGYFIGVDHEKKVIAKQVIDAFTDLGGPSTSNPDPAPTTARPSSTAYVPALSDITLPIKTLSKQCFGSAGCNLQVRVQFAVKDTSKLQGTDFEVTYEIRGSTDGSTVGTFEVRNGRYNAPEEAVQTSASSDEVTADVTSVEPM